MSQKDNVSCASFARVAMFTGILLTLLAAGLTGLAAGDGVQNIISISVTGGYPPPALAAGGLPDLWLHGSEDMETALKFIRLWPLQLRTSSMSRDAFESAIKERVSDADEDDVVLFSYVGHGTSLGIGKLDFVDCEGGEDAPCQDIASVDLLDWLKASDSRVLMVLNSCGSGGIVDSLMRTGRGDEYLEDVTILAASRGDENYSGIGFIETAAESLMNEMEDGEMSYEDFVSAIENEYGPERMLGDPAGLKSPSYYSYDPDFTLYSDGAVVPQEDGLADSGGGCQHEPGKVFGVRASEEDYADKIELKWYPTPNATRYVVYRADRRSGPYKEISSGPQNSYMDEDLPADTSYWYKVAACNSCGCGEMSSYDGGSTQSTPDPEISISVSGPDEAGFADSIVLTVRIKNTGNVLLEDIEVFEAMGGMFEFISELQPGQSRTFTTEYVVIQHDVDRGYIDFDFYATAYYSGSNYIDEDEGKTVEVHD